MNSDQKPGAQDRPLRKPSASLLKQIAETKAPKVKPPRRKSRFWQMFDSIDRIQ